MDRILTRNAPVNAILIDDAAYWGPYLVAANAGNGDLTLIDADGDVTTVSVDYDDSASVCAYDADADAVSDFA